MSETWLDYMDNVPTKLAMPLDEEYLPPPESAFWSGERNEQQAYIYAVDLEQIAAELIDRYDEFVHLRGKNGLKIRYYWSAAAPKSGGRVLFGSCHRTTGFLGYLTAADYAISLSARALADMHATRRQVEACLYHELCHTGVDLKTNKPVTVPHGVEAFANEVRRYGVWRPSLIAMQEAMQLPLALK